MLAYIVRRLGLLSFVIPIGLATFAAVPEAHGQEVATATERISRLGTYEGYSEPRFEGWVRESRYLTMRDGVRLAVDVLRPANGGVATSEPLPVVWTHHRYQRASIGDGKVSTIVEGTGGWLGEVIRHGYVVVAVGTRGGGASFGYQPGFFSPEEAQDAYEITEWLAAQPWSDGNIGMYGRSYLGITQYFAASKAPPHLKAIFPEMASWNWYEFLYPGGIFREDFTTKWSYLTWLLDTSTPFSWYGREFGRAAPVDGPEGEALWAAAIKEHVQTRSMRELLEPVPFRDSRDPETGVQTHFERSPWVYKDDIEASGVAMYHLAGWFDMFPRDALLWYRNLDNPQKLVIGPWFHTQTTGFDTAKEHLRWYDYWLKGVANGVMDEAPIHYWTMGAPEGEEWRGTWEWPLPDERRTDFYFAAGRSGTVESANDGKLTPAGAGGVGQDVWVADYTATAGPGNRWANGYAGPVGYVDLAANDAKGVTYTTAPLTEDTEVTGHPEVRFWISSTADDGDFFVYLEEVDPSGMSAYVTEGTLRASHRSTADPPYDYFDLPYHPSGEGDVAPLPAGEPVELAFDLHPTSNIFDAGNRIRVTITAADRHSARTPAVFPPPRITIYRGAERASRITLPIIPPKPASSDR